MSLFYGRTFVFDPDAVRNLDGHGNGTRRVGDFDILCIKTKVLNGSDSITQYPCPSMTLS